jgi:putative thiamine transport system substrate-binding protein
MLKHLTVVAGALSAALALSPAAKAADPDPRNWEAVLAEAKGQTVYFNAWGGSENINNYIDWAGKTLKERFGVEVVHVKLDDTANAVAKVLAEKAAGKNEGDLSISSGSMARTLPR